MTKYRSRLLQRNRNLKAHVKELQHQLSYLQGLVNEHASASEHWYSVAIDNKASLVAAQEVLDSYPKSLISRIRDWIA